MIAVLYLKIHYGRWGGRHYVTGGKDSEFLPPSFPSTYKVELLLKQHPRHKFSLKFKRYLCNIIYSRSWYVTLVIAADTFRIQRPEKKCIGSNIFEGV